VIQDLGQLHTTEVQQDGRASAHFG
jgi:hypothetical protein